MRALLPVCDPKASDSLALAQAARAGRLDVVRELIPVSDPRVQDSDALIEAATAGHIDVVRELIPVSDPKAGNSAALEWAVLNGHLQIARELIPVSDPRAKGSKFLRLAAQARQHKMVREIVPVSDASLLFRNELAVLSRVQQCIDQLNAFLFHRSTAAVDELTPHVSEAERDRAVVELPPHAIERMPHRIAWQTAQRLRAHLHQMAPKPIAPHRPRPSL
ncbi:hypothetical protein DFR29_1289 [Tahibacter aquaticus]|uniref:Ankyrin repeat protein n=1 Tax=Tahibacter aquaticus TaxID=520092 RepID=A0A4R6YIU8_9GAMM|nr:ankyrin repeat domain-containing protein [Tahibacter aquaticus]TDR36588.1 hypothetical protein DFR29_1289 [Tahibacter aquaticus]